MSRSSIVEFAPRLDQAEAQGALHAVDAALVRGGASVVLDLGRVEHFDSAGMGAVIRGIRRARSRGADVRVKGMSGEMLDFFSLVSVDRLTAAEEEADPKEDLATWVGARVEPLFASLGWILSIGVDAVVGVVSPVKGRRLRWDRIAMELEEAFLGALPIVLLIGFLLGLILAMQAYVQLRVWGADVYMANMVGVSVVYEIGPLMTGIILAARSGSSNAAQLGSMIVAEEIDALKQMGVRPVSYLVVPKVLALAFSVIALGLVFDCIAIVGGAMFGYMAAGIEPNVYMARTAEALSLSSFLVACAKCVVFGGLVGIVGCGLGLRVTGGSQGVGRATTNTVVLGIFLIIIVDALFVAAQQMWPT